MSLNRNFVLSSETQWGFLIGGILSSHSDSSSLITMFYCKHWYKKVYELEGKHRYEDV